ncbi:MAG: sulfatase [Planctomycetota bacterium]
MKRRMQRDTEVADQQTLGCGRILLVVLLLFCGPHVAAAPPVAPPAPRNFVFILIDDLGWTDLSCSGSTFHETPHLDKLAASGLRFTHALAACPVCSPTRASILTGRHPVRVGITDWIPGNHAAADSRHRFLHVTDRDSLALEETTLAEVLHDAGYQTFFAGKWHLGSTGALPTDQGFDVNLGGAGYGQPPAGYFAPWKNPFLRERADGEYLTERLTEECTSFLQSRDRTRPFLLFLAHYDVHTPIHAAPRHIERFQQKRESFGAAPGPIAERRGVSNPRQDNAQYASMVAAIDESVGRIMHELEAQGLLQSTTVVFTSDNGGLCTLKRPGPTSNLPLRSGKGWLYEGGIRVPLIVASPDITAPGRVCPDPVLSTDYFPTFLDLAGLPARPDLAVDGQSFTAALQNQPLRQQRPLAWHYPHYHGSEWTPGAALRDGDWKLIEFYEDDDAELYHLGRDPGERQNLAAAEPEQLQKMRAALAAWQKSIGAVMPEQNPQWKQP